MPTRYSPVRRFMRLPRKAFIARLACVRRAASVRPEPGSNSPSGPPEGGASDPKGKEREKKKSLKSSGRRAPPGPPARLSLNSPASLRSIRLSRSSAAPGGAARGSTIRPTRARGKGVSGVHRTGTNRKCRECPGSTWGAPPTSLADLAAGPPDAPRHPSISSGSPIAIAQPASSSASRATTVGASA